MFKRSSSNQHSSITSSVFPLLARCLAFQSAIFHTHTYRHTHTLTHTPFQMVLANASRNTPLHKDIVVVFHPFLLQSAAKKLIFSHVNLHLRNMLKERGVFIETALTCNLFFQFLPSSPHTPIPHCLQIQFR